MEAALLHQMQVIEHDVQTSLGMFKAAVGETESQQSGRALLALQRESDTGTYHFGANLGISIRHAGRIILGWIPAYYDTRRIVRVLGEDGTIQTAHLDPNQEQARTEFKDLNGAVQKVVHNPLIGKYDVSVTVGPSYNPKRMETAATLTEILKGNPGLMQVMGDVFFRSLDFPYADEIAERMKKMLPPPLQTGNDPAQQLMQAMQKMQMMGQQMQEMNKELQDLKSGAAVEQMKVQAKAQSDSQTHNFKIEEARAADQLARETAQRDNERAVWEARLKAATAIEVAQINSKTALTQAALQAETDANIELAKAMTQEPTGESVGGTDTQKMSKPMDKLGQMHSEHMAQSGQMMQLLAQALQQQGQNHQALMEHIAKPKTVRLGGIQRGEGGISGATATVQ